MADKTQPFRSGAELSSVSSTSDVDLFSEQRQRYFAHPPPVPRTHTGSLERVEEEPSNMADSSTDHKYKAKHMFYGNSSEQQYFAHNGPFKRPAQQGFCHRFPITPPYYENRFSCGNPMCREAHYCYEHQTNREYYNTSVPMPPSPSHYIVRDCHPGYGRAIHRSSPSFMNPNHTNMKRSDHELPRPKPEWPQGHRSGGNNVTTPATPAQYLASLSSKDNASIPPSTATSLRSINLEPFMQHSNFSSPIQSARLNRKRAMSSSPLSIDSIDINSLIRTSPDSLIAYINAPRLSSAGSYGHLSANGISPSPKPQPSPSMRSPYFGCWQRTPSGSRPVSQKSNLKDPKETKDAQSIKKEYLLKEEKRESKEESMNVDTNNNIEDAKFTSVNSPIESDKRESDIENEDNNEPERDDNNNEFICLWKDCNVVFQSQEELVKHVNTDHIKKERRDFTCYWADCQREQKPFKAQYMLVVHMRRHTGEKPNKCPYEGCNKAYSRLENLKTHERSHTGERPYVCEMANCTKAFTNASDRAKHQNRTHSSVKPYVCTVSGCTKRYTDPSSLRKHKKTCHPEHFTGAKKPKIDEAKGKADLTKGSTSTTKASDSRRKGTQGSGSTHESPANANPSSPSESVAREQTKENTQGHNLANIPLDFSPQSLSGDLTSSPSYVDSPQSNTFVCDPADQPEETSHGKKNIVSKTSSSPRSPQAPLAQPFPDRPEIGPLGGGGGGDVLVENAVIPNQISLPTINKQNEVGKWIADVSQRMNNPSKFTNEAKEHLSADICSRRSSESGVSSYISSRRSSEVSTHHSRQPLSTVPQVVEEMPGDEFPPNRQASDAYSMQQYPPVSQWNNLRRNVYDEPVRPSPIPDAYDADLRRSSSGYGSHHNLQVIRSPVFHKIPIQNTQQAESGIQPNRRMSDSIICEADSSNRYQPLRTNGNVEPRRSSEPATHYYSNSSNDFNVPNYSARQNKNPMQMDKQGLQQSLPDIYQGQFREPNTLSRQPRPQPLDRGQKLSHYPYSVDAQSQEHLYPHPPNYPQRNKGSNQERYSPRKGLWEYQQHINQQLIQIRNQQQQQLYEDGDSSGAAQQMNTDVPVSDGCYEVMVNSMGNLNTSEIAADQVVPPNGPSNMVVNDMNTLLNSLIEEDRYLEKKQGQENMTSALSHIF